MHSTGIAAETIVQNPDNGWLADRRGDHIRALRLYGESVWALAHYRAIANTPGSAARWHTLMGTVLASKGDLFDYAIASRRHALQCGFYDLDAEQLHELAALPVATPTQWQIRHQFLAHCDRHTDQTDIYGQLLPATVLDILLLLENTPPYRKQGYSGTTKRLRLAGQAYFSRESDETMMGVPPVGQDEYNIVSTIRALAALHPGIGPEAAYHLVAADGSQCSLVTAVPGHDYHPRSARTIAGFIDPTCLQWVVLAEWLLGIGDRQHENLIIDKVTGRMSIIDAEYGWRLQATFWGWDEEEPDECHSFARQIWEIRDPSLTFARTILQAACDRQEAVYAALTPFTLPHLARLRQQFATLDAALALHSGDIRVSDIEQIAQTMLY